MHSPNTDKQPMMKILVAVDLSDATTRVLREAQRIAVATNAEVVVIHAAEPDPSFVGYEAGPGVVRDQVAQELREEHRQIQDHAKQLRAAGLNAKALLIQGPVVNTTLKEAERMGVDLIVVGSHGHGAVYDMLIGSYSQGILREANVPVLVIPTRAKT